MAREGLREEVEFEPRERVVRPPAGGLLTIFIIVLITDGPRENHSD